MYMEEEGRKEAKNITNHHDGRMPTSASHFRLSTSGSSGGGKGQIAKSNEEERKRIRFIGILESNQRGISREKDEKKSRRLEEIDCGICQ
jgi:hypothetical protein